jgi:hypothetical protein
MIRRDPFQESSRAIQAVGSRTVTVVPPSGGQSTSMVP